MIDASADGTLRVRAFHRQKNQRLRTHNSKVTALRSIAELLIGFDAKAELIRVLGDLIADASLGEPLDKVEQRIHHEQPGRWMSHLSDQEQHVLTLRFGLNGHERHTLAEIGRLLEVSRERVRQVELKALRKLRNLTRRVAPSF